MNGASAKLTVGSLRTLSTIGVVCALAATYAAAVLCAADILSVVGKESGSVAAVLNSVAVVFILIALFVSAVVIGNGVDTVIAGRQQQLNLLRLIGASSRQLRSSLIRAVAAVATIGAALGLAVGIAGAELVRTMLVHNKTLPNLPYSAVPPTAILAGGAVVITAVAATYTGAHRTLTSAATQPIRVRHSRIRSAVTFVTLAVGALLLLCACWLGEDSGGAGFITAFFGAALTSSGILIGARRIIPGLVSLFGRAIGRGPAAVLARRNAVSDPLRTTRCTLGILIGVTLVTTICAGMSSLNRAVQGWGAMTATQRGDTAHMLSITTSVLVAMVIISVIIASVGFISTMSLTIIGRTREIGMLRAMGFTAGQVRSMVFGESLALSGTAVIAGLGLGILFGAVGSQSLIGSITTGMPIGLPLPVLAAIVAGTLALVVVASLPPSRRAIAIAPIDALAIV